MARNEARYREAERKLWESFGVVPGEQRLDLRRSGVTLRVQEVGEGPAVVFVHGASNAGSSWAPLVARLPDFRCVLLDRPGCGLSDRLAANFDDVERLGAFADGLVADVLDALGLESAHVVATSFGGYIALRTAAAEPRRVGRMVLFGWSIGAPVGKVPLVMRMTGVPVLSRLLLSVPPNARAVRAIFRQIGLRQALEQGRISQEALDWFLALLRDTPTMRNEVAAGPRIFNPVRGMNERILLPASLLARVQAPVHFVWGEEDPFGGAEIARSFVAHLPNAGLELLPGTGHAPWMDDADHAAMATRSFLQYPAGSVT
ncbi:MAG: alpha/beta hydrolase [Chloroflexi bacterium]|nr:alpha/beta hydrolase [Chloroflexota bacterium]